MELRIGLLLVLCHIFLAALASEEIDSDEHGQYNGVKSPNCTCGWTNKARGRIVGGEETQVNEYPYMAGLGRSNDQTGGFDLFCGSTIISPHHAITAAHCTYGETKRLAIIAGEHDLTDAFETKHTKIYMVDKIIQHEAYDDDTCDFDISLLMSKRKIVFNLAVGPACLPSKPIDLNGQYVKITGWGNREDGISSPVLMKVNVKVLPLKDCGSSYKSPINQDNPHQICTQTKDKDSCKGDSGGPVTWLDPETNRYTLVGVVSYGRGCASGVPAVSTDVSAFIEWIQHHMHSNSPKPVNTCSKND